MADPLESMRAGISEGLHRLLDQRAERRAEDATQTAVMNHCGHRHVVRVANLSKSGAMIAYTGDLGVGEELSLQLLDHGVVTARVRWVRDGRVGVSFAGSVGPSMDERRRVR